jgi:hypothetical protein
MVLTAFRWLSQTSVGAFMQQSQYAFAAIEIVHLLALALLGGIVLFVDLSLLGFGSKKTPVGQTARELLPLLIASLVVMAVSGVLLLSEEALKCYYNPAFRWKMLLLFLAVSFYFTLHRKIVRSAAARASFWSKAAAVLSLTLWLGVGLAGRAIGFL